MLLCLVLSVLPVGDARCQDAVDPPLIGSYDTPPSDPRRDVDRNAPRLRYSFVEAGSVVRERREDGGSDFDPGFGFRGSLDLDPLYFVAAYERPRIGLGDNDFEVELVRLGVGARTGLASRLDLTGEISGILSVTDGGALFEDDRSVGYEARVGVRWLALPYGRSGLELEASGLWRQLDSPIASDESQLGWRLEARAAIALGLALVGGYERRRDDTAALFGLRFSH